MLYLYFDSCKPACSYHVDLIRLLAECASGKIGVTEAKCRALISLRDAVAQAEGATLPALKAAFIDFVASVYINTEYVPRAVCICISCIRHVTDRYPLSSEGDIGVVWRLAGHFVDVFAAAAPAAGGGRASPDPVLRAAVSAVTLLFGSPLTYGGGGAQPPSLTALAACCGFDLCYKYIWYLVFGIWYLCTRCSSSLLRV